MEDVAHWAVVQDHDLAQVWFHRTKVLDVGSVPQGAVLSVISALEELSFLLKPVDDRVCILLNTGREDNEFVPLAHLAEKLVTIRSLMDII